MIDVRRCIMSFLRFVRFFIAMTALVVTVNLLAGFSCQLTPESQKSVEEATKVPGLEEALIVKDRAIKTAIVTSIKSDVELLQNDIQVEVSNAKVILTGSVPTEEMKARAENYAKSTEGVIDVLNKIEVDPKLKEKQFSLDDV